MLKPIIVLGILLLVGNTVAEELEMGPYLVSFDMGDIEYTIDQDEPYTGELCDGNCYSHYSVTIDGYGIPGPLIFQIFDYNETKTNSFLSFYDVLDPFRADVREVDGKDAVLFLLKDSFGSGYYYNVMYSLDGGWIDDDDGVFNADKYLDQKAKLTGNTIVGVRSTFDWGTTRQFLNTIHVERRVASV